MNVKDYLRKYGDEFKPDNGISRKKWEKQRYVRLKKEFINVKIDQFTVAFVECNLAHVSFDQIYESPNYKDHTRKTLALKLIKGQWKIIEEKTIKKY